MAAPCARPAGWTSWASRFRRLHRAEIQLATKCNPHATSYPPRNLQPNRQRKKGGSGLPRGEHDGARVFPPVHPRHALPTHPTCQPRRQAPVALAWRHCACVEAPSLRPRTDPALSMMRLAFQALLLALLFQLALLQTCGTSDVRSRGAAGNGANDDTGALQAVESDGNAGVIYLSPGTYRITRSLTLNKPIIGAAGSVLQVGARQDAAGA